jgi:hypothetical protein
MSMTTPVNPRARAEAVGVYQAGASGFARQVLMLRRDHAAAAASARSIHAAGGLARLAHCGYCLAGPWEPCLTSQDGASGYHLARFARAERCGLIGAADLDVILAAAGDGMFSGASVIRDRPAWRYLTSGAATAEYPAAS